MTREDIKTITDIIHKTIYGFFDVCVDGEETPMTDKEKLLLEVNKAICTNIKALEQEPCDVFDEYGNYKYPSDVELIEPNTATSMPCGDAISRQAVLDLMRSLPKWYVRSKDGKYNNVGLLYDDVMFGIDNLSPVTPKQRTGHWIETAEEYYKAVNEYGGGVNEDTPYFVDDIACSECLSMFSVIDNETERFDCCPHCGAKMVEPQESEDKE